jgi:hypothetical protein
VRTAAMELVLLNNWIELALKGEKVTKVFSTKELAYQGDGKSIGTAIHFAKARTHAEGTQMIYRFLDNNGIQVTGPHELHSIKDGFVFDVIPTNNGPLWFGTRTTPL